MKKILTANPTLSVQQAFEQFQRFNQVKNLSPCTIDYYNSYYKTFAEFLADVDQPVSNINQTVVENYILYLKEKDTVSDTTVNTALRMVRARFYISVWEGAIFPDSKSS